MKRYDYVQTQTLLVEIFVCIEFHFENRLYGWHPCTFHTQNRSKKKKKRMWEESLTRAGHTQSERKEEEKRKKGRNN